MFFICFTETAVSVVLFINHIANVQRKTELPKLSDIIFWVRVVFNFV
nr:MAG TPA: colicin E8 [Caudoviricetes sp.]